MPNPSIAIVILAAGGSARMRLPKQLLPHKGKSFLQHTIDESLGSKADFVYVVLGASADRIQCSLKNTEAKVLINECWRDGLSTSIKTAMSVVPSSSDGVIISLCDQPNIASGIFNNLIEGFANSGKSIIASKYDEIIGAPVLFSHKYFTRLNSLEGDGGAKGLIQEFGGDVEYIPFPGGNIDIDTADDYQKLVKRELNII